MAGPFPTSGAVHPTQTTDVQTVSVATVLFGPLSRLVGVAPDNGTSGQAIKAIWQNEIGDAQ